MIDVDVDVDIIAAAIVGIVILVHRYRTMSLDSKRDSVPIERDRVRSQSVRRDCSSCQHKIRLSYTNLAQKSIKHESKEFYFHNGRLLVISASARGSSVAKEYNNEM